MNIVKICNGKLATNTYIVYTDDLEAIVIDPADDVLKISNKIDELNLNLKYIINTHGHGDHIAGNKHLYDKYSCEIIIHEKDASMLQDTTSNFSLYLGIVGDQPKADITVKENDIIELGDLKFIVIETPGHTKGSICLYEKEEKVLFSGDTLFNRSIGRSDLPGGSMRQLLKSLEKLLSLPGDVIVYPGHSEDTKISFERKHNPFARNMG